MFRTKLLEPGAGWPVEARPGPAVSAPPLTEEPAAAARTRRLPRWWSRLPRGLGFSALVYLISRVPIVVGLLEFLRSHRRQTVSSVELRQDGWWYIHLAQHGYSHALRPPLAPTDFHHRYSDWAFYPGYPLLIRGLHELTRLSYLTTALLAASLLGLTAVWAMYALGNLFGGVRVARGTALLVAAWPGSAAFSFPYSEGLFITATALALIFLHRQRWLWAGVAAGVAIITRPTGVALLGAISVVAAVRLWQRRDWRPLVALPIAASGGAAFALYGWARTGDPLIWRHAENLWGQKLDFSEALVRRTLTVVRSAGLSERAHQLLLLTTLLETLGLLMLLLMAVAMIRTRQWAHLGTTAYAVGAVGMIVGYSDVSSRPRMVLAVLPGFIWSAAWLPRRVTIAVSACFLVLLAVITYAWSWQVTP